MTTTQGGWVRDTTQLSNHPHTSTVTERLSYSGHSCSIHNIKGCRNKLLFSLLLRIRENAHLLHFIHNITTATIQHESSFHENLLVTLARGLSVTAFLFPLLSSRHTNLLSMKLACDHLLHPVNQNGKKTCRL